MRNSYENANAKLIKAGLNCANRTEAGLTEVFDERMEGEVEYEHDGRRRNCSFFF